MLRIVVIFLLVSQIRATKFQEGFELEKIEQRIFAPDEGNNVEFNFKNPNFVEVTIKIFDINGAIIRKSLPRKENIMVWDGMVWDGRDSSSKIVKGGVYIYQVSAEGHIFNGTIEEAGYRDNQFSVIHSSHLIEHLTNPSDYITEAFRILKPGGLLITTTPNTRSLQAWLFGKNWRSAIADHMYLFSDKTLSSLLLSNGFKIITIKTWGGIAAGMAPGFIKKPLDFLAKKFGFGDVVVILAKKKG